jgi:hypothetical protein
MIFTFIDGDVDVPEKLLRECLADLKDTYPDLRLAVAYEEESCSVAMSFILDWLERNDVAFSVFDLEEAMAPTPDRVYALIGDKDPDPEVATVLKAALAAGIEVRDLAEAGVTVVRIDGTVPTTPQGEPVAEEEVDYTWVELGRLADDDDADEKADAQQVINDAFIERDLDGDAYATWLDMAIVLGVEDGEEDAIALSAPAETVAEPEPDDDKPGLSYEDLKDVGIRKLRDLAKAAKVDPKLDREALIEALVNGNNSQAPPAEEVVGGETFEDRGPAPERVVRENAHDRLDAHEERIAALESVINKLTSALT